MRRGWGFLLLVVALLLGAGAIVAALRLSGKTIEIRVVDVVPASPTLATLPITPPAPASTITAQPTPHPTDTQATLPPPPATATQPAGPVAIATNTPAPSATPVE